MSENRKPINLGDLQSLASYAEESGFAYGSLYHYANKYGMPVYRLGEAIYVSPTEVTGWLAARKQNGEIGDVVEPETLTYKESILLSAPSEEKPDWIPEPKGTTYKTLWTHVPFNTYERVKAESDRTGTSLGALVKQLIEDGLHFRRLASLIAQNSSVERGEE